MRVVSSAGPLIHLARAGYFDLPRILFRRVLVPPGVYEAVVVRGRGQDGATETAEAGWIVRRRPRRGELVTALGAFLGRGEAEAIALAGQREGTLLLMDEAQGRRVAARLGAEVKGTLGLLLDGCRAGHVPDLEAAIGRMRDRGSWVGDDLVSAVLAAAKQVGPGR